MSDFSGVTVTEDTPGHLQLSGQATRQETVPVTVTATVLAGDDRDVFTLQGERTRTVAEAAAIESVTDDLGGVWAVAADGKSASLNA